MTHRYHGYYTDNRLPSSAAYVLLLLQFK